MGEQERPSLPLAEGMWVLLVLVSHSEINVQGVESLESLRYMVSRPTLFVLDPTIFDRIGRAQNLSRKGL